MNDETKYSLIIIGVALIALVAFNYNDFFTGSVVVKDEPTRFMQERLTLVRTIDIPNSVKQGSTIDIIFSTSDQNDLIKTNKEKVVIYKVDGEDSRFKKQLTYPRCVDGLASTCYTAEDNFALPVSWSLGKYKVQVEREINLDGKAVTEIIGRAFFDII